jgi:hypothetical protein
LSAKALVADSRRFFGCLDFAFKNFPMGVADGKMAGSAAEDVLHAKRKRHRKSGAAHTQLRMKRQAIRMRIGAGCRDRTHDSVIAVKT